MTETLAAGQCRVPNCSWRNPKLKLYEAMFLLNPNDCARDWEEVQKIVHAAIEREDVKIVLTQKLDDQRLAYEVAGHKRATYYLVHLECDGQALPNIRRTATLTESILRALIVIDEDGAIEINPTMLQSSYGEGGRREGGFRRGGAREGYRGARRDHDAQREPRRHETRPPRDRDAPPPAGPSDQEPRQPAPADAGAGEPATT